MDAKSIPKRINNNNNNKETDQMREVIVFEY